MNISDLMQKVVNQPRRKRVRASQRRPKVQLLERRDLLAGDMFEPNNSLAQPWDIGSSSNTYSLTIDPAGDIDVFQWKAPGNGVVRFDALFSQAQGDLDMYMYNSAFTEIDASTSLTDNERVETAISQNQTVYVKLSEFSGTRSVPYTLKVTFIQPDSIDASTPNNSLATANNLGTGDRTLTNLNIHNSTDEDYFRWTATVDGRLNVNANFLHFDGDLSLKVLTSAGVEITASETLTDNEQVSLNVFAGTDYIIKVSEANHEAQPRYDLQVTFGAPPVLSSLPSTVLGPIGGTTLVNFTVDDPDTPLSSLQLTGTSDNQFLVPNAAIVFSGTGRDRMVSISSPGGFGWTKITISVDDQDGGIDSHSFDLGLFLSNAAPVISSINNISLVENSTSGIINFTVSDAQTPAAALIVTATSSNTSLIPNQNIALGGSGSNRTIQVTPAANQIGSTVITVFVQDEESLTSQTSFLVTVFDSANQPRISPINDVTISEDTSTGPLPFTVSDADTPLDNLTFSVGSSDVTIVPTSSILISGQGATRSVSVTPAPNANGTATISLTVSDGQASYTETFNVTVTPVNDSPTISTIANRTIPEDTVMSAVPFTVGDVETPASALTVTGSSDNPFLVPASGIIIGGSGANRTVSVVPIQTRQGNAVITLTVNDGTGGTASSSFTLTVTGDDDPPMISPIADRTIYLGQATTVPFTISDDIKPSANLFVAAFSSNQLIIEDTDLAILGTGDNRSVSITPKQVGGPVTISVLVSDGFNNTTELFDVTVAIPGPSISAIANQVIAEDTTTGPLAFTLSDPDTPADSLTVTATSDNQTLVPNANIAFAGTGANRTVTVTPAANGFGGPVTITLTASDGTNTAIETFTVNVTPVADPPTISAIADQVINENTTTGPLAFTLADIDTPATSLTVVATSSNQAIVPNANIGIGGTGANRTVTVTPAANANGGPVDIVLTVSDGTNSVAETFSVTVNPVDDRPTISMIADQVIDEDTNTGPLAFTVGDTDTPLASLTVTAASGNQTIIPDANIVVAGTGANRTVTVTPAANANGGPVNILLRVSDGTSSATEMFTVTVTPINDLPTISAIADQVIDEDTSTGPLAFTLADVDTPLASLTVTATSSDQTLVPNANVVIAGTGANRTVTVTPVAEAHGGPVDIVLTVGDGASNVTETFTVTVTEVDDPPTITAIADQVIDENTSTGPLAFTLDDVDTPLASLTVTAISSDQTLVPNANIVIQGSGANRTVTVTPATDADGGPATITVTVGDGTNSVVETFNVTVTPVMQRVIGDSNHDGVFNSTDLIQVLAAGEYEDAIAGNSTWEEGDWNEDGDFNTTDFIFALAAGTYENDTAPALMATLPSPGETSGSTAALSANLVDLAIAADDMNDRKDLQSDNGEMI